MCVSTDCAYSRQSTIYGLNLKGNGPASSEAPSDTAAFICVCIAGSDESAQSKQYTQKQMKQNK